MFGRKKKEQEKEIRLCKGVVLEFPYEPGKQNALFWCFPKGILVFLIVFGSLGGFISAFDMECNYVIPALVLLASALFFSGLFAFQKMYWKDLGYIIYFVFFVAVIYLMKSYVNSGFAAIINEVKEAGEVYFGLNTGTEFAEKIDDRYLTITVTFIFIGMFEVILLNIFISNYMSLKLAVFVSMPMYALPLYFQKEPDLFFAMCMLCGYMGIYIFKNSGHFKEGKSRRLYEKRKQKEGLEIAYTQNGKVYRGILIGVVCCTLAAGICSLFYDEFDFRRVYKENSYKEATRDGVSGFIMMGFRSFYRGAYSRGGVNGGKLGNLAAIRPDNETDLVVRFAPFNREPVYLKGYTGICYGDNEWIDGYELLGAKMGQSPYFHIESMSNVAEQLKKAYKKNPDARAEAVMEIENKGANVHYVYYPYFTLFDDYGKYEKNKSSYFVGSPMGQVERMTYYPNIGREEVALEDMKSYLYTDVPEKNRSSVDRFLAAAGVKGTDEDAVERVVAYLKEECSYSYSPGRVPDGQDFINYFLDENKKGVCAHFASAATLIFRRMGIPARYVEGYAFGYEAVLNGKVRDDLAYEDYYRGYSELGETAVMEVEVSDANAHAWVEIYEEGKGWRVVDPTPVSLNGSRNGNIWDSISDFWQNSPDLSLDGDISGINLGFLKGRGVKLLLVFVLGMAVLGFFVWQLIRKIRWWRSWHGVDLRQNVIVYYRYVCRKIGQKDVAFAKLSMPSEQMAYLIGKYNETHDNGSEGIMDGKRLVYCLEKICFGPAEPNRNDYNYVMKTLKKLR